MAFSNLETRAWSLDELLSSIALSLFSRMYQAFPSRYTDLDNHKRRPSIHQSYVAAQLRDFRQICWLG
jgi:hypothetical protein